MTICKLFYLSSIGLYIFDKITMYIVINSRVHRFILHKVKEREIKKEKRKKQRERKESSLSSLL